MSLDTCDEIWNRATEMAHNNFTPRLGDSALRDVLMFDGSVNNGGLLNAVETYSEDTDFPLATIIASYRALGLTEVAELITTALTLWIEASESDSSQALEDLELALDPQYVLETEEIEQRLRELHKVSPELFAAI